MVQAYEDLGPVVIVGNGVTRQHIELDMYRNHFRMPIFGCNALYREYKPDLLFAIDDTMINEILQSSYPRERFIVPPLDEQFEPPEWNPARPRENTGMVAMKYAIQFGSKELHCIGMDFIINNENLNMSNVFENTPGYGPTTKASYNDTIRRAQYFEWFVNKHPNVMFYIVFPDEIFDKYKMRLNPKPNLHFASIGVQNVEVGEKELSDNSSESE